ncbi:MAG TPA: hypothetical protein VFS77_09520 [Pyrinomonadaceae bacterium]|nr:hypothetical protein [Pyrinomonadaceae bacterium]
MSAASFLGRLSVLKTMGDIEHQFESPPSVRRSLKALMTAIVNV